jgi:hypothetical protein
MTAVEIRTVVAGVEIEYTEQQIEASRELLDAHGAEYDHTTDKSVVFTGATNAKRLVNQLRALGFDVELCSE